MMGANTKGNLGDLEKRAIKVDDNDRSIAYKRVCDEEGNALLQQLIDAVNNNGGGGGGNSTLTCQKHVVDLIEDTWVEIPHTYNNDVCDWKAVDSLGCAIEIGFRYDAVSLKLEACASTDINNVLIILEGEL